jgi:hypothetical protein
VLRRAEDEAHRTGPETGPEGGGDADPA